MRICVRACVQGWVTRGATHARAHTWLARTSRNYRIHRPAGVRSELDDEKIRLTVNDEASVLMNSLTPPPYHYTTDHSVTYLSANDVRSLFRACNTGDLGS